MSHTQDFTLLDYIQIAMVTRHSIRVDLSRADGDVFGHVYIQNGEVWSAACDGVAGIDALEKLLYAYPVTLTVNPPSDVPIVRCIHSRWYNMVPTSLYQSV